MTIQRNTEIDPSPTPEQLFQIASVGVTHAKTTGKLKQSPHSEKTHTFLADEIYQFDVIGDKDFCETTYKYIGSISRAGFQKWSMRIVSPYWVRTGSFEQDSDVVEDGYRLSYIFEWGIANVYTSQRIMHVMNAGEKTIEEYIAECAGLNLDPDFIHCINEFSKVTASDCDRLLKEMREFSSIL